MPQTTTEGIRGTSWGSDEGQTTKLVEQYTSKLPSSFYLGMAFGAIGLSAMLQAKGRGKDALFVGQWVAPFMLMGIYNKMIKLHGSD